MQIHSKYMSFLRGENFDSSLLFNLSGNDKKEKAQIGPRLEMILKHCRNRRVLHIGCCDYLELTYVKYKSCTSLHDHVAEAASECVGIDIFAETASNVHDRDFKFKNIIALDVMNHTFPELILSQTWDVVLLSEVIERLSNPCEFLRRLHRKLNECSRYLLLTAPNAFRLNNFRKLRRGMEHVSSDQYFWFTPYTLAKVLTDAGFIPAELSYAGCPGKKSLAGNLGALLSFGIKRGQNAAFCDDIIMLANF